MKKLVLSAFACDPRKGSEPGNGWNWAIGLANKGFEVHCFTRVIGKAGIEDQDLPENICFHYITLPLGLEKLYKFSTIGMYLYYILWQWFAYKSAKRIIKGQKFSLAHHVTWGSFQMGSFMYRLNIPFVFGPVGGGQVAPAAFKRYFLNHWKSEERRDKVGQLMLRFNPACKNMIRKAQTVLVTNIDTFKMAKNLGANNLHISYDAALPKSFFPKQNSIKDTQKGKLNLLWVGRFMPRKGILLLLDVMKELKHHKQIILTVVGDGEMRNEFNSTIDEFQLTDTVIWKGMVPYEEVRSYYENYDVFFFTSLRDSCPAQIIEAMAYGMPVVTLDLHGQGFVVNNDVGIKCSVENPDTTIYELKEAILKLSNNPSLVHEMSNAAFKFAAKQSWDEKIETFVQQYYPVV